MELGIAGRRALVTGVGDVGPLRVDDDVARGAERLPGGGDLLLAAGADRDVHALAHELLRDREAEALRAAGDERAATGDPKLHATPRG